MVVLKKYWFLPVFKKINDNFKKIKDNKKPLLLYKPQDGKGVEG